MASSRGSRRCTVHRSALPVVAMLACPYLLQASPALAAAPAAPELVAPVSGHVFPLPDPQVFVVRATDFDGDHWVGVVEVRNLDTGRVTTFVTAPASSGATARTVALPPLLPGRHAWRARAVDSTGAAGPWAAEVHFEVGPNRAPNPPGQLAPAHAATLHRFANAPFAITAVDPDGDAFTGTVTIRDAGGAVVETILMSPSGSGGVSVGVLRGPLAEGDYTWTAEATDVYGARSGPSTVRSFTVAPPPTGGGGLVAGTVAFGASGIPPANAVCAPSSPTYDLHAEAALFNVAVVGYLGPVDISGTGASTCESVFFGTGSVTLDVTGTGPTESTVTCPALQGSYTRVETVLTLSVVGGCTINNHPVGQVKVGTTLAFVPAAADGGTTTRVYNATVLGPFHVVPR